jgi:outer membrane receptor protein involved in Fe transport
MWGSLTYFSVTMDDLINIENGQFKNTGKFESRGIEAEGRLRFNNKSYAYGNYVYQEAKNKTTNQWATGVAKHKAKAGVNYRVNSFVNVNVNADAMSSRPHFAANRAALPKHAKGNATLTLNNLMKDATFRFSVYNLTDENYADPSTLNPAGIPYMPEDFIAPGRSFMLEVAFIKRKPQPWTHLLLLAKPNRAPTPSICFFQPCSHHCNS